MRLIGNFKLSHQIIALIVIIPFILTFSLLYFSAMQQVTIRNKPLEQIALATSNGLSEKIDRNLKDRYSDVQAFALSELATKALQNSRNDSSLVKHMNNLVACYGVYDLMMLCDLQGTVLAVSTKDNNGNPIQTHTLLGKNKNEYEWFRSSIVTGGPRGGAYYSDFNEDEELAAISNSKGFGVDFSAPVRTQEGSIIGVWRTRASWKEITQQIRTEAEASLPKELKGGILLVLDNQGHLIDANQEQNIMAVTIGKNNLMKEFEFNYAATTISPIDFIYGWAESKGSFGFKGNQWRYLTLLPKVHASDFSIYTDSDWTNLFVFSIVLLFLSILIGIIFVKIVSKRINTIKNEVLRLSKGDTESIAIKPSNDELGEMAQAVQVLTENFKNMANFSSQIGSGNLTIQFSPASEKDILGKSLVAMQENLVSIQQANEEQLWISNSLAALGELLRMQEDSGIVFSKLISFLAKSAHAHQAIVYAVHHKSNTIRLKAGYAISEHQLTLPSFEIGEGNVGQCIASNSTILLKNIPEDYTSTIQSGLGAMVPSCVYIFPIHFNGKAEGALEFSFFKIPSDTTLLFIEKSTEYLGSYMAQLSLKQLSEKVYSEE